MSESELRVAVVASHPVQYQAPWFRALGERCELHVFFAHRQTAEDQARAGYGVAFDWDVDVLGGYAHTFLVNRAKRPSVYLFRGCDTPEVGERLAAGGFDACIVCGWHLLSYWQAVWACRRRGIPVLVRGDSQLGSRRGAAKRAGKRALYPWMLRAFDGFLSPGQRHREYLRHYGVREERIHAVPHFVDVDRFRRGAAAADRAAVRRDLGVAVGERLVLFVGRLVPFKRPLDAIEAVARLGDEARGILVAVAGAGPLADAIVRRAGELGVRLAMLGFRNQAALPALYAAADVLVLPSDANETWGLVVNEAMACGLPAVVSDAVGCAPDLVDDGATGFRYPCGSVTAFAVALGRAFLLADSARGRSALEAKVATHTVERAAKGTLDAVRAACVRRS